MACALLLHPRLFLVDEPSLGLSPAMVTEVFETIKQINDGGTTIVMVEQNAKRALAISSHAVVLDLGTVRMEGSAREIRENPDVKHLFLGE
jgi:branched-chain amino acid transport system ATP-binding protein